MSPNPQAPGYKEGFIERIIHLYQLLKQHEGIEKNIFCKYVRIKSRLSQNSTHEYEYTGK